MSLITSRISKHDILTLMVIVILMTVIGVLYFADSFDGVKKLVFKKIENEYFTAEISIINPNREFGVSPNDELIYFAYYDIKSNNTEWLNPIIEIEYRDNPTKTIKLENWRMTQDGLRFYQEPILIEDLGYTTMTYETEFKTSNSFITLEHERKGITVKTISELQQERTDKANNRAFIITAIIGSITAFAILGTYFTTKNNSRLLEEQKNIMEDNFEKQVKLSNTENQLTEKHTEFLAMLEVMKIFNDDNHANKRDALYKRYRTNSLYDKDGGFLGQDTALYATSVRGTFDNMGKLVSDGYVNKDQFLSMYFGSVIRMYKVLKLHIETERTKRGTNHFAVYFEQLYHDSMEYWKKHYPHSPEPEPY